MPDKSPEHRATAVRRCRRWARTRPVARNRAPLVNERIPPMSSALASAEGVEYGFCLADRRRRCRKRDRTRQGRDRGRRAFRDNRRTTRSTLAVSATVAAPRNAAHTCYGKPVGHTQEFAARPNGRRDGYSKAERRAPAFRAMTASAMINMPAYPPTMNAHNSHHAETMILIEPQG